MCNINYNDLLDAWAEKIMDSSHKHQNKANLSEEFTYSHGYNVGFSDGLAYAVATLTTMENREKRK